jgi:uncharacterized protein DUF6886
MPRLFHISGKPGIRVFEPRLSPHRSGDVTGSMVWAIDEGHIQNYLLPRDCPRVTFFASKNSTADDTATFLGPSGATHVIAVEACWLPQIQSQRLVRYEFDSDLFDLQDATAGYWICREPVMPIAEVEIESVLAELLTYPIEFRVMRYLWKLREAVIKSSLEFSIIRMRNAGIPPEGVGAYHPLP